MILEPAHIYPDIAEDLDSLIKKLLPGHTPTTIPDFPISWERLLTLYEGYSALPEPERFTMEALFYKGLQRNSLGELENALDDSDRAMILHTHFNLSTVAFYRMFQLFLASLLIDKNNFRTWSEVTAYYSRFYFIHALCICSSVLGLEFVGPNPKKMPRNPK